MLYSAILRECFVRINGPLPAPPDVGDEEGLVVVADGVGGLDLCGTGLSYVMARARPGYAVRVHRWGHGLGRWHRDLSNVANHARQAEAVAEQVREFHDRKPGRPAFLVGKSGGSGVVARALETLPEGSVEAVVLLAPALSPTYDLSGALRAVRRELVVFWSPWDVVVLGLGTRLFGTIDRVKTASAGMVGFREPAGLDHLGRSHYGKLRQVKWRPRMARTWYFGGHVGPDSPPFLREYVAPLLDVEAGRPLLAGLSGPNFQGEAEPPTDRPAVGFVP